MNADSTDLMAAPAPPDTHSHLDVLRLLRARSGYSQRRLSVAPGFNPGQSNR